MTSADLDALLAAQGGVCAICRTDRWSRGVPNVDHCHETNSVRGILCTRCNLGIGYFMDDPARLTAAAKYLGDHFAKTVAETIRRIA
jgi:hypothetical protein